MKAAAVYAQRLGWAVMPLHDVASGRCSCGKPECPSAGKHPRLREWQRDATSDAATVAEWIAEFPSANVGVLTGRHFFVLDVDPDNGGPATLAALEAEHGALPVTATQRTGSGGTHYLFALPDFEVRNSAGRLGRGLDTRGHHGQIVLAPSVSAKGAYVWIAPPWKTPIAPAPEWLLAKLRAPAPTTAPAVLAQSREAFPPASAETLAAAALALELHGPAIQGHGGDEHTFKAGAILSHDFALTPDEAWPLALEWNATCQPPWSEADLRVKLANGQKYATRAYGCKRQADLSGLVRQQLAAWQQGALSDSDVARMGAKLRETIEQIESPLTRRTLDREVKTATGFTLKDLKVKPPPSVLPDNTIAVGTMLHETADAATAAIADQVFARNGTLCEIAKAGERVSISELETARVQDLMSQASRWAHYDDGRGWVEQIAPLPVATVLHARREHKGVRLIEAVTTAPIFLPDGSVLQTRGYNKAARVWFEPNVAVLVPDEPTRDDAINALDLFRDLLDDFHFADEADFSAWVAGLVSPLVKAATRNAPAPLVCFSASSPGAGKTLLTEVIARVVTGGGAEVSPYNPRDPGEWGKRLTAFVRAASPVRVFDNCNGPIGDEALDRLITSSTWSDRILGASEAPPLPNVTSWFATGNNIEPQGDTVRRVLMCRIEVDTERPQERTGFRRPMLAAFAEQHRSTYLSAALTMLRAFHVAGRPAQGLAPWGSFVPWSDLVRESIVWSGGADPFITQQRASRDLNEPENEAHDFWLEIVQLTDGTPAAIVGAANQRDAATVLGMRDSITAFTLRKFIGRFVDRPRLGKRLRKMADRTGVRYYVEVIR